ncbi:hypothetical protein HDU93_008193 [Gonapodya sp. JEL0774]|nr:hypothetical protein HDU93_008193 [Gonapodya sp. JEL0774]
MPVCRCYPPFNTQIGIAKSAYLEARTLYDSLCHVAFSNLAQLRKRVSETGDAAQDDPELMLELDTWTNVTTRIALAEAKQVVRRPLGNVPGRSPFGLDIESVERVSEAEGLTGVGEELAHTVIIPVESHLQRACEQIVAFAYPTVGVKEKGETWKRLVRDRVALSIPGPPQPPPRIPHSSPLPRQATPSAPSTAATAAKSLHLNQHITRLRDRIRTDQERAWDAKQRYVNARLKHGELLSHILSQSSELLLRYKMGHLAERDEAYVEYYKGVLEGMAMKLRLMKLDALRHVFTPEHVANLLDTRTNLLQHTARLNSHLAQLRASLASYDNAGAEFNELVEQWRRLEEAVEEVQGDVGRLGGD